MRSSGVFAASGGSAALEAIVEAVQIFAQQAHDVHAEFRMFASELQKRITLDEVGAAGTVDLGGEAAGLPRHTLGKGQDCARSCNLKQTVVFAFGGEKQIDRALHHEVDALGGLSSLKQPRSRGVRLNRPQSSQRLPKAIAGLIGCFWAHATSHRVACSIPHLSSVR